MRVLLSLFFMLISLFTIAQNESSWIRNFGSNFIGAVESGRATYIDEAYNVYTAGTFEHTVDFDPGPDVFELTSNSNNSDMFLQKLDADGNLVWAVVFRGGYDNYPRGLKMDAMGNLLLIGTMRGGFDADPGPGTTSISTGAGSSNYSGFIIKLDSDANLIWAKPYGMPSPGASIAATDFVLDTQGSAYLVGSFFNTLQFDDTSIGSFGGSRTMFVMKVNSSGNLNWLKRYGQSQAAVSAGWISINIFNDLVIGGSFSGTVDFDPSAQQANLTSNDFGNDGFVLKLNGSGDYKWVKATGGPGNDTGFYLDMDQAGNIYNAGYFQDTIVISPSISLLSATGQTKIFIQKMTADGTVIWAKSYGNVLSNLYDIAVTESGGIYLGGSFEGNPDFDPGTAEFKMLAEEKEDAYLTYLSPAGDLLWGTSFGGTYFDDAIFDICTGKNGAFCVTGRTGDDAGFLVDEDMLSVTAGGTDAFTIYSHDCLPELIEMNVSDCNSIVINEIVYSESGAYTQVSENLDGCDSLLTVVLSILNNEATVDIDACGIATINGMTYDSSGVYEQLLLNQNGCDSLVTYHLRLLAIDTTYFSGSFCVSTEINGETYTDSGVYEQRLTNVVGCDSLLILELDITNVGLEIETAEIQMCLGDSVILNAEMYPNQGVIEWTPNLFLNTNNTSSVVATPAYSIDYAINATIDNCMVTDTIFIRVDSLPDMRITPNPDKLVFSLGENVTLGSPVYNEADYDNINHLWLEPIPGQQVTAMSYNMVISTIESAWYYRQTNNHTCSTLDSTFIEVESTSVGATPTYESFVQLFPNPLSQNFWIDFDLPTKEDIQIQVMDATGKLFLNQIETNIQNKQLVFDLSTIPDGVYICKIQIGNDYLLKRIVKQGPRK